MTTKHYFIYTFGCAMNEYDTERIAAALEAKGYIPSNKVEDSDFVLLNTCSVREKPQVKILSYLGQIRLLKEKNPNMIVGISGCVAQQEGNKFLKNNKVVNFVMGTDAIARIDNVIERAVTGERFADIDVDSSSFSISSFNRKDKIAANVTIMKGCNNFCSYCIVPYVRGRERSREPEEIIGEIKRLVEDGVVEVMLLGQNVNSYGKNLEHPITFAELLRRVDQIEGLRRIRFMTSHPKDLSDELIQVMQHSPKICRHLHLPLQAGSDRILEAMNRRYTKEQYLALVEKLKRAIPDIAITTDIIVGFPGETSEDVEETMDVVRRVQFDNAFTFIYSPRTGTPAAAMENQASEEVVHENFDRLLSVVQETAKQRAALLEGKVMEALVEEVNEQDPAFVTGRLSNNMLVHFKADKRLVGKFVMVKLDHCHGFYYTGRMVDWLSQSKHTRLGKMVDNQWLN